MTDGEMEIKLENIEKNTDKLVELIQGERGLLSRVAKHDVVIAILGAVSLAALSILVTHLLKGI